jgi:hypothetical protein
MDSSVSPKENLVSARVPSHFKRSLPCYDSHEYKQPAKPILTSSSVLWTADQMVRIIQMDNSKYTYFWKLFCLFHHEPQQKHSETSHHLCKDTWQGITGCDKVPAVTLRAVLPHAEKCNNLCLCFAAMCKSNCTQGKWFTFVTAQNTYHVTLFTYFRADSQKYRRRFLTMCIPYISQCISYTRIWNTILDHCP